MPGYDPDRARALLAEAGYPADFRLSLHTYADRPGFGATAQAIAQMWTRIGDQTAVEPTPTAMYMGRGARREFSMPVFSCLDQQVRAAADRLSDRLPLYEPHTDQCSVAMNARPE